MSRLMFKHQRAERWDASQDLILICIATVESINLVSLPGQIFFTTSLLFLWLAHKPKMVISQKQWSKQVNFHALCTGIVLKPFWTLSLYYYYFLKASSSVFSSPKPTSLQYPHLLAEVVSSPGSMLAWIPRALCCVHIHRMELCFVYQISTVQIRLVK